ncbi:MAG: fibronectin type III domain-containing protein [Methanomassiliicoccales archaeon]|nr:MAG: fibronectin type III domain-containing protein [Methanomassiliicoccales archaeon]
MKKRVNAIGTVTLLVIAGFLGFITFESDIVSAANTIYVDDDNTIGPWQGTLANPYRTVQDGINASVEGDTVYVLNGTYHENVLVNRSINLTGMNKDNTTIDGGQSGDVIMITANWTNVTGFTVINSAQWINFAGIKLDNVNNCSITDNNISDNWHGIRLDGSDHNNITNNNISANNRNGIRLNTSDFNLIKDNNVTWNSWESIYFYQSFNNEIINNNVTNDHYCIALIQSDNNNITGNDAYSMSYIGIYLTESHLNDVLNNNVNTVFLTQASHNDFIGNNISGGYLRIWSGGSHDNTIKNNNISDHEVGIHIKSAPDNHIINNNITNNTVGIHLESASSNNISGNDIWDNIDGINITLSSEYNIISKNNISSNTGNGTQIDSSSKYNTFYHNNFIDNTVQAYDNGTNFWNFTYPTGGNFWSDWTSYDSDCDGFFDEPRLIVGGSNQDNWPFMKRDGWTPGWRNKTAFSNYAPSGMPDFDQRQKAQPYWMTINAGPNGALDSTHLPDDVLIDPMPGAHNISIAPGANHTLDSTWLTDDNREYAYCGPTAAANGLWWLDSRFANHSGTPGDGNDDFSLVIDLGAGDDHLPDNVPLLIEDLAGRFKTNETGATNASNMVAGLNQLFIDRNLELNYSAYNESWPLFEEVTSEFEECKVVILFLGFYSDEGQRIWGHIVTVSGVNVVGPPKIAISDPIKNVVNPIAAFGDYNDPYNVSHDDYDVVVGSPHPSLPPESWYLLGYNSGYGIPIPLLNYTMVENAVFIYPHKAPSAPWNLTAKTGETYVNISWNASLSDGGSPITNYTIYRGTEPGNATFLLQVGNINYYNDTNVTGGIVYYYQVAAVNSVGEGTLSIEKSGMPLSRPSAPKNLSATFGDSYINLTWDLPDHTGSSIINVYYLYRNDTAGIYQPIPAVFLWYNDTGVTNGVNYTYNVTALNSVGEGPNSTNVSITPMTFPSIPRDFIATPENGSINLTWAAPASDGGSNITDYYIYRNGTTGMYDFVSGSRRWYNDTNVINGLTYTYNISAVNRVGEGLLTQNFTVRAGLAPSPPRDLTLSAGDTYIYITWKAPISDGGMPITNYKIYKGKTSGGETLFEVFVTDLFYTDNTVTNGFTYYYIITAVNDIGESSFSEEVSDVPFGLPDEPTDLKATAGDSYIDLTWKVPFSDGGSQVTNYKIYRSTTSDQETFLAEIGNVLSYHDTDVTNNITYFYKVTAITSIGESPFSFEVNATPAAPVITVNQLPTCTITTPTPEISLSGIFRISGEADDSDGTVERVEIRVDDDEWITIPGTTSWSYDLNTTNLTNGKHTIYIRSFDGTNYSLEASMEIQVSNPGPEKEKSLLEEPGFWAGIIILLVIVLIVIFMLLKRRKPREDEEEYEEEEEEEEEDEEEE